MSKANTSISYENAQKFTGFPEKVLREAVDSGHLDVGWDELGHEGVEADGLAKLWIEVVLRRSKR